MERGGGVIFIYWVTRYFLANNKFVGPDFSIFKSFVSTFPPKNSGVISHKISGFRFCQSVIALWTSCYHYQCIMSFVFCKSHLNFSKLKNKTEIDFLSKISFEGNKFWG